MPFDFDRAVRWAKPDHWRPLTYRPDEALPFLGSTAEPGAALLLDTSVYIDQMQGRAPQVVGELVYLRAVNHSSVAIVELMHPVGRLDPSHPDTPAAVAAILSAIRAMPPHRVFEPDVDILGRAAILAGVLARLQGYSADDRLRALHDCVIFVQALKLGFTVLTRNSKDYDLLLQMVPAGRALLYRRAA